MSYEFNLPHRGPKKEKDSLDSKIEDALAKLREYEQTRARKIAAADAAERERDLKRARKKIEDALEKLQRDREQAIAEAKGLKFRNGGLRRNQTDFRDGEEKLHRAEEVRQAPEGPKRQDETLHRHNIDLDFGRDR